jgi:L-aspartate oxidase
MTTALDSIALDADSTLIIGAGVAGLYTALQMAPRPVTVITAAKLGRASSSTWAQGGLAAAMGEDDTPELHFQDTVEAGAGLVEETPTRILTEEGPDRVRDLINLGVAFDTDETGKLKLGMEAAHSRHRIVHATGDQAGAAIMDALTTAAQKAEHITIKERIVAEDILITSQREAIAIVAYDIEAQKRLIISCPRIVLATGGLGGLYKVTTNPVRAQGHGLAMALRAGAEIIDPEFVQFHPTALDVDIDPAPLATEALRGEGATLVDKFGFAFMQKIHEDADLAPRDIVARGVAASIMKGNGAFLNARDTIGDRFQAMFPTVYAACKNSGIDPVTDLIPVSPAAHYHMGGVGTDVDGRTSLAGLWAVGEVASTGIHGANRLASNSLLEALVFGYRAAQSLKADTSGFKKEGVRISPELMALPPAPADYDLMQRLRKLMSERVGMIRDKKGLQTALKEIGEIEAHADMTSGMQNALLAATLIASNAYAREESRGSHYRQDHTGEAEPHHLVVTYNEQTGFDVKARPLGWEKLQRREAAWDRRAS